MASRRIRLVADGVVAEAELLTSSAPLATEALWSMLPIERRLISAKWSGDVAVFHPGPSPLSDVAELEGPVTSIYPGTIVMRPRGSEVLIGYGVGEYRWGTGVDYCSRIAEIDRNRTAFLAALARTATEGIGHLVISAIEAS